MHSIVSRTLLSLTAVLGLLSREATSAQCAVPDGLDNGFPCAQAQLVANNIQAQTSAYGICFQNCQPAAIALYTADWGVPAPHKKPAWNSAACGWYTVRFKLSIGNQPQWSGKLRLTYSRTWIEANPVAQYQVWRFLANGDLSPVNAAAGPCIVPPCAASFGNLVRFTGYIDYAFNCVNNAWEHAWMLNHSCDRIDHDTSFPRGGNFHPDFTYAFVGPTNGFNIGVAPTLENGGGGFESMRSWDLTSNPPRCRFDERLQQFSCNTLQSYCNCGVGPAAWHEALLGGSGVWGSSFFPVVGAPSFLSFPIGSWTNLLSYPGQTELRWNTATLMYVDPCLSNNPRLEHFFGVSTLTSNAPFQVPAGGAFLPQHFLDLGNSMRIPPNVTTHNVPYWSDHVLNLNL